MQYEHPVFECTRADIGTTVLASFYCPHCKGQHTHGDPDGSGGHRVAHCYKTNSPYLEHGYVLAPATQPR